MNKRTLAGVQVFNTAQFPATAGPLGNLEP
jgi:hypothetical protein